MDITICKFKQGKGVWKFNCSLLKNKNYLIKINEAIEEEKTRYNFSNLTSNTCERQAISYRLFLETLLMRLRGESIIFSTKLKREQTLREKS